MQEVRRLRWRSGDLASVQILTLPCRVLTCPGRARCSGLGWSWSGRWRTWHSWRRSPGATPQSATPPAAAWSVRWQYTVIQERLLGSHAWAKRLDNTSTRWCSTPRMLTFRKQEPWVINIGPVCSLQLEQCGDYPFFADMVSGGRYKIRCTFIPDPACPILPLMSKCPPKISVQTVHTIQRTGNTTV